MERYAGDCALPILAVALVTAAPRAGAISISHVERQNLTMHTGMRRFIRRTNRSSKKLKDLGDTVALRFMRGGLDLRGTRPLSCRKARSNDSWLVLGLAGARFRPSAHNAAASVNRALICNPPCPGAV